MSTNIWFPLVQPLSRAASNLIYNHHNPRHPLCKVTPNQQSNLRVRSKLHGPMRPWLPPKQILSMDDHSDANAHKYQGFHSAPKNRTILNQGSQRIKIHYDWVGKKAPCCGMVLGLHRSKAGYGMICISSDNFSHQPIQTWICEVKYQKWGQRK